MNSPIKWVGGKKNLRKHIVSIMPDHTQYCEVFSGALWVMLEKKPSKIEIINDINGDLINFYKVIHNRDKLERLVNMLYFLPKSREIFDQFDRVIESKREELPEVRRAAIFYYLLKLVYGGRYHRNKKSFAVSNDGRKMINYDKFPDEFIALHERIKNSYIEKQDFQYILNKYDREDGLFFLDPPYLDTTEDDYGVTFGIEKYNKLSELLNNLKGKFILTCNDKPELRELFKGFYINDREVFYSISHQRRDNFKELIITNYDVSKISK